MKTALALMVLAAMGIWGLPAITLSEKAAIAYLDELEAHSMQGRPAEYCERMHDDLEVAVVDGTSDLAGTVRIEGGRQTWCDHIAFVSKGITELGMRTSATRKNFQVSRRWFEPWTARVSYDEERTSTIPRQNVTLRTESSDRWILVNTVYGVRVLGLESNSHIAK